MKIISYVVWVALLTVGLGCGDSSHAVNSETLPDSEEGAARIEGEDAHPIQPKTPVEAIANANPEEAPEGPADTPAAEITEIDSTDGNDNSEAANGQSLLTDLPEAASVFHSQIGAFTIDIPSEMHVEENLGGLPETVKTQVATNFIVARSRRSDSESDWPRASICFWNSHRDVSTSAVGRLSGSPVPIVFLVAA